MILHLDNVELTSIHINKYETNCLKTDHILTEKLHQNCFDIVMYNPLFIFSETIIDKRNGIPYASEGDKSYQAVEYSPSFHKGGSSLPSPQFG